MLKCHDLENNFFLDVAHLGQSRGHCAAKFLCEMNDNVKGCVVEESVSSLLESNPHFFTTFTLVIASQVSFQIVEQLSLVLNGKVPLIYLRNYGMLGYLRIDAGEHTVLEAHPGFTICSVSPLSHLAPRTTLSDIILKPNPNISREFCSEFVRRQAGPRTSRVCRQHRDGGNEF